MSLNRGIRLWKQTGGQKGDKIIAEREDKERCIPMSKRERKHTRQQKKEQNNGKIRERIFTQVSVYFLCNLTVGMSWRILQKYNHVRLLKQRNRICQHHQSKVQGMSAGSATGAW